MVRSCVASDVCQLNSAFPFCCWFSNENRFELRAYVIMQFVRHDGSGISERRVDDKQASPGVPLLLTEMLVPTVKIVPSHQGETVSWSHEPGLLNLMLS